VRGRLGGRYFRAEDDSIGLGANMLCGFLAGTAEAVLAVRGNAVHPTALQRTAALHRHAASHSAALQRNVPLPCPSAQHR
jgi:hypothetical protein